MKDLKEQIAEIARPKTELQKKAEKECSLILDPASPHFRNYVLMYLLGHTDGQIQSKEESLIMSSNLLG